VKRILKKLTDIRKSQSLKSSRFSRANLIIFAIIFVTIGGYVLYQSRAAVTCDLNATTSDFAAQVTAATAGQTICLASGNYGTFSGTSKAITIAAATGATPQMLVNFGSGDGGFTLDGMTNMGGSFNSGSHDITVRNSAFNTCINFSNTAANANILLDSNTHLNIDATCGNARIALFGSGVTIRNSLIQGGDADGVFIAANNVTVENNRFIGLCIGATGNHTDAVQFADPGDPIGGYNAVVRGNYFADTLNCTLQSITSFDSGTKGALIENNVIDTHRWAGIEVYSDENSVIRHNTVKYYPDSDCSFNGLVCGQIDVTRKADLLDPAGVGTQVYDNITTIVNFANGSTGNAHHNVSGQTAVYQGGANPTSHDGYLLASNSPVGKNAASDGTDIGAYSLGGVTPPPPPSDITPPTVSVTAPTASSTVTGSSVALSASASDNVGVSSVQFRVDGNNVGSEDTTSPYTVVWDSRLVNNGSHTIIAVAKDAAGNSTTSSAVTVTTSNSTTCKQSSSSWQNTTITNQTGSFTFDFDATPSANIIDTVTGLSAGAASDWSNLAPIVLFSDTGTIQARNGGAYAAVNNVSYSAGTTYHLKMTINVASHTYSVTVTPSGGSETTIATNYAFRTEQANITSLNNWATYSLSGSQTTCGATLNQTTTPPPPPPGPKTGDINGDNAVNITDLSLILSSYNQNTTQCVTNNAYKCDLSNPGDGVVNIFDLSILMSNYGK
jgi:hypothetical protein